jgi:hypothetical protein
MIFCGVATGTLCQQQGEIPIEGVHLTKEVAA